MELSLREWRPRLDGLVAAFLAQYPRSGTGTWSFLQVLASEKSETPNYLDGPHRVAPNHLIGVRSTGVWRAWPWGWRSTQLGQWGCYCRRGDEHRDRVCTEAKQLKATGEEVRECDGETRILPGSGALVVTCDC